MVLSGTVALLRRPRLGAAAILALHLISLGLFIHGFLLTRVHLPHRSAPPPPAANRTAPPYDRVVWLMVDALRYDFVVADQRYSCAPTGVCHQGHMPFLSDLARRQGASRAFMFIADAPTTTTQRLKSLATGGLPSFFDVSSSFTAGAVPDDNLIDQLAAAGKRLAFLGDITWQQLFPRAWAWSRPYPCFNVRDLHTVDDGVWAHLLPVLRSPDSWGGLLLAHYLGVDHCGHSHGVSSREMAQKLRQMDEHVRQVVEALVEGAGPGGAYRNTLLLVSGDHGQTLGGDHGGGSPEEVDSALVAVDVDALRALRSADGGGAKPPAPPTAARLRGLAAPAACRASCSCGVERNQCAPDLPQTDLTPTLAAMLGVPIPFGNLGKLSRELWQLAAARVRGTSGGGDSEPSSPAAAEAAWERSLVDGLEANAAQVHAYLNTYAATPGTSFSRSALAALNRQYAELAAAAADPAAQPAALADRCYAYLRAAAGVAREQWTQFRDVPMAAGLALFAATLALQAAAAFGGGAGPAWRRLRAWELAGRWRAGRGLVVPTFRGWLAGVVLAHCLGLFSFFYLLSEGSAVCYLVAAACGALALSTARAARAAGERMRGVLGLGAMSLRFNAVMAVLGLAHHTGQGFWARLTVHDPQPDDDVERGLQGKLAQAQAVGAQLMARTRLDQLPAGVLAVARHSLLCTLPVAALALATDRLQRGGGAARGGPQRLLQLAAFASVAAYLQVEEAGRSGLLPPDISLSGLVAHHLWPLLPAGMASRVQLAARAVAAPAAAAGPAAIQLCGTLAGLPLRELLPHATYALCGGLAVIWLLQAATGLLRGAAAARAAAQLVLALLLQVSDRQAPLILLLGLLMLVAIAKLMARRAALAPGGVTAAGVAGEAAALAALVAAQMFYVTGHLCEFAGLQYTAGFVGSGEFLLWRSGSLIALNTFGSMLLVLLALPAISQHIQAAAPAAAVPEVMAAAEDGEDEGEDGAGLGEAAKQAAAKAKQAAEAKPEAAAAAGLKEPAGAEAGASLGRPLLVAGLVRSAAAFCATLSAGLQRRHLYAWALFAPKFAFEACFLLLSDLVLLLLALVA